MECKGILIDMFLKWYDSVTPMLEKITASTNFDADRRNSADSMRNLLLFVMTGPLSRIVQRVNIDFGKALNLLDAALEQLFKLRSDPQKIIHAVEGNVDGNVWEEKRISRRRGY